MRTGPASVLLSNLHAKQDAAAVGMPNQATGFVRSAVHFRRTARRARPSVRPVSSRIAHTQSASAATEWPVRRQNVARWTTQRRLGASPSGSVLHATPLPMRRVKAFIGKDVLSPRTRPCPARAGNGCPCRLPLKWHTTCSTNSLSRRSNWNRGRRAGRRRRNLDPNSKESSHEYRHAARGRRESSPRARQR